MLVHPLNRRSCSLLPCCARAHTGAEPDRERLQHASQRDGWAGTGRMLRLPAPRTPLMILSHLPFWAALEHAVSAVLAGLPQVSGCRRYHGRNRQHSSGRGPRVDALRLRQSCRVARRSGSRRSRSTRPLGRPILPILPFAPRKKVRRFAWPRGPSFVARGCEDA